MRNTLIKLASLSIVIVSLLGLGSFVDAQTVEELQQKITAQTSAIDKLEKEIEQYQGDLTTLASKKKTLKNAIATLDVTRKKLETDIRLTQTKVDTTDLKIRQLGSEIVYKEDEITARVAALKETLLSIYESDEQSLPEIALSNESFSGIWNDFETLQEFGSRVSDNVNQIKSLKTDLEVKNKAKQTEKNKLLDLKDQLGDKKKVTEDNKKQTTKFLTQASNQESQYQKILSSKLALKDALEKELRDYESTLKFILDPTSIPPRGTKVFALPVDGLRIPQDITQQFGKTVDSVRLYASGTHNGTDFRVSVGTPMHAMLSGTVMDVGDTDQFHNCLSYGKWVLIKHNNGLATLYAHFSLTKVVKGQTVKTGDLIGYSGNTGYTTGPHLHLTVFASAAVKVTRLEDWQKTKGSPATPCSKAPMPVAAINAYLNPMDYL